MNNVDFISLFSVSHCQIQEKTALDSKIDRLEKDLKEYRRITEDQSSHKRETFSEENISVLIQEVTERKEEKVPKFS